MRIWVVVKQSGGLVDHVNVHTEEASANRDADNWEKASRGGNPEDETNAGVFMIDFTPAAATARAPVRE